MKPEEEVRKRANKVFNMRNLHELSRRSGYAIETLRRWRMNPLSMRAVDLIRLENITGVRT